MDTFQTRSSSRKNVVTMAITFLCLFALSFLALKAGVAMWIFVVVLLVIVMGFCFLLTGRTYWILAFEGTELTVFNHGNKQSYVFDDLTGDDFVITQSEKQKLKNTCDMRIKGASVRMDDVVNYSELQKCIQQHY